uniref:Endoplasmic reticulum junction formation protein lunapark n=1 Tax=Panagrolaimus sp. ES5 TaxID=591445 RepID=A0AC34GU44_9BILA
MGSVFSKKVEPKDELASVVEKIKDADQAIISLNQQEYTVANYSMIAILVGVSAMGIKVLIDTPGLHLGLVAGGVVIVSALLYIFFRICLKKYYNYRTSRQGNRKNLLTQHRSEILKEIKENLPFKQAREIILKYGTEDDLTSDEVNDKSPPKPSQIIPASTPMSKNIAPITATPINARPPPGAKMPQSVPPIGGSGDSKMPLNMSQFKTPIRPFPGAARTPIDRIIDFVVGDGPNNRYALICKRCQTHNGMALPEEFLSLSYKCFNCDFVNPSKRTQTRDPALSSTGSQPALMQ